MKKIQLFNLKEDITESNDLSEALPEKVEELMNEYKKWLLTLDN